MSELLYRDESYRIVGACFEVYNQMGCGFLEAVYQECLMHEFSAAGIPFRAKVQLPVFYKGQRLDKYYEADFICFEKIILEIKTAADLAPVHSAQAINYLNATKLELAILVSFGSHPKLQYKRLAHSRPK
ncbi:MAG: GxxExxY protein [Planctomycetales bacterium]|nr:GxxExxY protein [Planctomycetales bacterium]